MLHPDHVIVRLYLPGERIGQDYTRDQISSARANGCSVGGYVWLYHRDDISGAVQEAVALARSCDVDLPVLWFDVEPYADGSLPTVDEVLLAVESAERAGVKPGIYTGAWVINGLLGGTTALAGTPLWSADYTKAPDDLSAGYGGWDQASGHQWTSTPVDQSVFIADVT